MLKKTNSNLVSSAKQLEYKNIEILDALTNQMAIDPIKTKKWKDKADSVFAISNPICRSIDSLINILENGNGKRTPDFTSRISVREFMIYQNNGKKLVARIKLFPEKMLTLINDTEMKNKMREILFINKEFFQEEKAISEEKWFRNNFEGVTLIEAITNLNRIKNEVVSCKLTLLEFLYKNTYSTHCGVDRDYPIIICDSKTVHVGEEFKATIILVKRYLNSFPLKILIGKLRGGLQHDCDWVYSESLENPLESFHEIQLDTIQNVATYKCIATNIGTQTLNGTFVEKINAEFSRYIPFSVTYEIIAKDK